MPELRTPNFAALSTPLLWSHFKEIFRSQILISYMHWAPETSRSLPHHLNRIPSPTYPTAFICKAKLATITLHTDSYLELVPKVHLYADIIQEGRDPETVAVVIVQILQWVSIIIQP